MSLPVGRMAWQPPSFLHHPSPARILSSDGGMPARTLTPVDPTAAISTPDAAIDPEEDSCRVRFAELYHQTEARISILFADDGSYNLPAIHALHRSPPPPPTNLLPLTTDHTPISEPPPKRVKRTINEDDYDDDEDEDDGAGGEAVEKADDKADDKAEDESNNLPGRIHKSSSFNSHAAIAAGSLLSPSKSGSSPVQSVASPHKVADKTREPDAPQVLATKATDDARRKLEQDRTATEEMARRSFWSIFYTLENDRTAMLEQQQLEEAEKLNQVEMEAGTTAAGSGIAAGSSQVNGTTAAGLGTLSSANLGASSLTLKHLVARIDLKRERVHATDAELRLLINEVRKNRSKWASEDNANQEELYEALEKVLTELKAHTEYSTPFLSRVNKRDAPNYYNFIKNPMDLGSMTKKLKILTYKSKADFVADLNLVWDNCLKYNQDLNHPLRRMANGMRKEAEKLIPLIPDLTIRPRAEVEAEERRKQNGGEDEAIEDSDDEPIMSSRGRTAATKGANKSRKAPAIEEDGSVGLDHKPLPTINGVLPKGGRGESSERIECANGLSTPKIGGSNTPSALNGHFGMGGSHADTLEIDVPSLNAMALGQAEAAAQVHEDEEYKIWKQVTKKDRARVTEERYHLFKDGKLNVEAPALLRTKAGLRRFLKNHKAAESQGILNGLLADQSAPLDAADKPSETLAEGIEGDEEAKTLPDYYEPLTIVPDIPPKLRWLEDGEGQVINHHEEFLRVVPRGHFLSPSSQLTRRMESNMRQIQETRKIASRISVVKQMQLQTHFYMNQFPKTAASFVEQDIEPHFIADQGPVIAPETCRAALERSIAKLLYTTGYEELQPLAMDTLTGIASDYFQQLVRTFKSFSEAEKKDPVGLAAGQDARPLPRYTLEETVLHCLDESGHDLPSLEAYATEDVDRLDSKLAVIHDRMKLHLTDLLRPALTNEAGTDGVGAFNDGSEQFVGGDFAEDLGEDFFGFRALGLDKELGLDMISVPLHLLQSRVRNQYQMNAHVAGTVASERLPPLPPLEPLTTATVDDQIGLVKDFFHSKLDALGERPLVEDEDLPVKQRRPRPRLGNTGKIISPQKPPPREQIAMAKKRKKMEQEAAGGPAPATSSAAGPLAASHRTGAPAKKLKLMPLGGGGMKHPPSSAPAGQASTPAMERIESSQTDREDGTGMMSPESLDQMR